MPIDDTALLEAANALKHAHDFGAQGDLQVARVVVASYLAALPACETAKVASAGEIGVRRNDNGSIDEVVAKGVNVHLEQMDNCGWFLGIDAADRTWQFWLRGKSKVEIYHEAPALSASNTKKDPGPA